MRANELHDPLAVEIPSDDETDVDDIVGPIQAPSDDDEGEP